MVDKILKKTNSQLISSLNDLSESERLYTVDDISESSSSELSLGLLQRLKIENSGAVKNSILSALQKTEYPSTYREIFNLFPNKDAYLRNSAVSIFGSYGEGAVTFLSSYIDHSNKEVRKLIIDSLVEIATNRHNTLISVLEILRACLYDPDINVVITTVEYLGILGDINSLDNISELYKRNEEPMLRFTILEVILKIGQKKDFEKVLPDLFLNDFSPRDSLEVSPILKLLAQSGRKEDFLTMVKDLHDISFYSEDILVSIDWLVKNENFKTIDVLDILIDILQEEKLKEDLRFICVQLLLASGEERALDAIRNSGSKGNDEFSNFCKESVEVFNR